MNDYYAETINGLIFEMSRPKTVHIRVAGNIHGHLFNQFRNEYVIIQEPNLYVSDKDVFHPDLVICREEIIESDGIHQPPELVVEITSSSTRDNDRGYKFNKYFDFGVLEYWLIEPNSGVVDVYVDRKLWKWFSYVTDEDYKLMYDEQKKQIKTHVESKIFPSLDLKLEDLFYKVL